MEQLVGLIDAAAALDRLDKTLADEADRQVEEEPGNRPELVAALRLLGHRHLGGSPAIPS